VCQRPTREQHGEREERAGEQACRQQGHASEEHGVLPMLGHHAPVEVLCRRAQGNFSLLEQ